MDGVLKTSGKEKKWAYKALSKSGLSGPDVYCEISPSGRGIRLFGLGTPRTQGATNGSCLEVYSTGRYLTVTGLANGSAGSPLINIEKQANKLSKLLGRKDKPRGFGGGFVRPEKMIGSADPEKNVNYQAILGYLPHLSGLEYSDWLMVGMVLHFETAGADWALKTWIDWAETFDSFTGDADCVKKWAGFSAERGSGGVMTLGSLKRRMQKLMGGYSGVFDDVAEAMKFMNLNFAIVNLPNKVRVLQLSTGSFLTKADYWLAAAKYKFVAGEGEKQKIMPASDAWITHGSRTEFDSVVFDPSLPPLDAGDRRYNLFEGLRGVDMKPVNEMKKINGCGWACLKEHMYQNICGGDKAIYDYLFGWLANIVQNPGGDKVGVCFVMRGGKGVGKSKFVEWVGRIFGAHYVRVADSKHVTGQFNSLTAKAILMFADEAFFAGDSRGGQTLKSLITDKHTVLEMKGVDAIPMKNYTNLIMASNSDWVVPASADERRFFIVDVGDADRKQWGFFADIDEEMADGGLDCFQYDLMNYRIPTVNGGLRNVPSTAPLRDQMRHSWDSVQKFWSKIQGAGEITYKSGSPVRWKSDVYDVYLEFCGVTKVGTYDILDYYNFGKRCNKLMQRFNRLVYKGRDRNELEHKKLLAILGENYGEELDASGG